MNITLYYIPGINETDTPVFDTLQHQRYFFDDQERYVIQTGFYPPYFRNTITLDIEDYDFTSPSNYCSLNFNNKDYYYFIEAKRYINESVVEIDITMDVIQTYMFDIRFNNAFLERESIPRWKNASGQINRDYIRENVSTNDFSTLFYRNIINMGTDDVYGIQSWAYVVKASADITDSEPTENVFSFHGFSGVADTEDTFSGQTPYRYFLSPYITMGSDNKTLDPASVVKELSTNPYVVDIYLIPFRSLEYVIPLGYRTLEITGGTIGMQILPISDGSSYNVIAQQTSIIVSHVNSRYGVGIGLDISQSAVSRIPLFSYRGIPQLADSNYIKLKFGDNTAQSQYPLEQLTRLSELGYAYWADISTGTRYYNISVEQGEEFDNTFNTIAVNHNILHCDLKNDKWETYIANNHATLTGAMFSSGVNILSGGAMMLISPDKGAMSTIGAGGGLFNKLIGYATNKENLEYAPDTMKKANSAMPDVYGKEEEIAIECRHVIDIEFVAHYFESYGYKVNRVTSSNLFTINNRLLYDYVQTKELNITFGDKSTENEIISRFNRGLRMWHTTDGVLTCKSVNTAETIDMGQLCIVDNIETFLYNGGQ